MSSSSLRAQNTVNKLVKKTKYTGRTHFMEELYLSKPKILMNTLSLQDDQYSSIFLVGHNPELTELANILIEDNFSKLPTMAVLAIDLDIDSWTEIEGIKGTVDFFIQPKQFKYYVPKQIRTILSHKELKD